MLYDEHRIARVGGRWVVDFEGAWCAYYSRQETTDGDRAVLGAYADLEGDLSRDPSPPWFLFASCEDQDAELLSALRRERREYLLYTRGVTLWGELRALLLRLFASP